MILDEESSLQCLVFHELPYGDEFRWPGLVPLEPQPTAQQLDAVDRLIDRLDLSQLRRSDFHSFTRPMRNFFDVQFYILNSFYLILEQE